MKISVILDQNFLKKILLLFNNINSDGQSPTYTWRFVGFLICRGKRQILLICRGKKWQKQQMYITTLSDNEIREFLAGESYKNIQFSIIANQKI